MRERLEVCWVGFAEDLFAFVPGFWPLRECILSKGELKREGEGEGLLCEIDEKK
jgi:hypothetical protein